MAFVTRFSLENQNTTPERTSMKEELKKHILENGINIHELRRQGYKVHISHKRVNAYAQYLTRREYETVYNILNPEHKENRFPYPWKDSIEEKGGKTLVEITKDGENLRATAICSEKDNYSHKYGVKAAFHRALGLPIPHEEKAKRQTVDKFRNTILTTPPGGVTPEAYCEYLSGMTGDHSKAYAKRLPELLSEGHLIEKDGKLYSSVEVEEERDQYGNLLRKGE